MGGASLSNFFITVIVKTLETSQLCKASFLVLSCNLFGYKLPVAIFGITCGDDIIYLFFSDFVNT